MGCPDTLARRVAGLEEARSAIADGVVPILVDPDCRYVRALAPVALVDENVDAKGTREAASAYVQFLYSPTGQALAAKHFYRPSEPQHAAPEDIARFPQIELFGIDRFGGWAQAQAEHFNDGGVFDKIYKPTN